MKILHLMYNLAPGGAERLVVDLCNQLSLSNEVYLCIILSDQNPQMKFYKEELSERVNYISIGAHRAFTPKSFVKLITVIKKIKPDIVHGHLKVIPYIYSLSITLKGIQYFQTIHSAANLESTRYLKYLDAQLYSNGTIQPITISKESKKSFFDYYGFDSSVLIENGRANSITSPLFNTVKQEINSFKKNKDTLIFIHVGRSHPNKNQQMLFDVFSKLRLENKNVCLIVIGSGFNVEIKPKNINNIYFLGTKLNVIDYLLLADAFCLSSLVEGLPISLLEALSCGTTPICTPAGGIPSVLKYGEYGLISRDFSEKSYYNTIQEFLLNPQKINRQELIKYYNDNYSINVCANKHIAEYSKKLYI